MQLNVRESKLMAFNASPRQRKPCNQPRKVNGIMCPLPHSVHGHLAGTGEERQL